MGASSPVDRLHIKDSNSGGDIGLRVQNNTSGANSTASIHLTVSGTDGFNSATIKTERTSGALIFERDGNERMRIDSSGRVGIGTSSPQEILHVAAGSATVNSRNGVMFQSTSSSAADVGLPIVFTADIGGGFTNYGIASIAGRKENGISADASGYLQFATGSSAGAVSEKMRIDSSGNLLINTNSQLISGYKQQIAMDSSAAGIIIKNHGSSNSAIVFLNSAGNAGIGSITTSNTSTSFNTSSDYRLKENVVDIADGITRVKQLQPKRFNFIADADTTVDGFVAHEAQAVVPEAVTGEKDGEEMQGIDQSKLVPLLTAALQEAIAKIETLEAKVAALEAG
jgi:hypothetical protein